jgi:hypothetical protein
MGKSCPMKGGAAYQDWGGDGQGLCGKKGVKWGFAG